MQLVDDLVMENAELQQRLTKMEADLIRAEETIRREQQQMKQVVHAHIAGSIVEGL